VEAMDILVWCVLALLALVAAWGWETLYEWFVEPANHHTVRGASSAPPDSTQHG